MSGQLEWWNIFCPRIAEMRVLQSAFERVASGTSGPELIVIVAESGLGKTRLVQEFFGWLSTHKDGVGAKGYWPDALTRQNNNLVINPRPQDCIAANPMPFLWWGIRLADPGRRNEAVAVSATSAFIDSLEPHLEPMYRARLSRRMPAKIGEVLSKGAFDASIDLAGDALSTVLPGIGVLKTVVEKAFEVTHILKEWRAGARKSLDRGEILDERRKSLLDALINDLSELLSARGDDPAIPTVLVIDDAHFARHDPVTLNFVSRLLTRAQEDKWPILVLATHWDADWSRDAASPTGTFHSVVQTVWIPKLPDWRPFMLGKVEDLSVCLAAALPGLAPEQIAAVLEKVDGNPRLLDEVIRWLSRSPKYFEGRDTRQALSPQGLAEMRDRAFSLHELVEERLKAAPREVQAALGVSAAQGIRFLALLTADVCGALNLADAERGIELGIDPHRFAVRVRGAALEFAQRVFHEVASGILADVADPGKARWALAAAVRKRFQEDAAAHGDAERDVLLAVAADLFEHDDEPADRAVARKALCELTRRLLAQHDYESAGAAARRVEEGRARGAWSLTDFTLLELEAVSDALAIVMPPNVTLPWVEGMVTVARAAAEPTPTPTARRNVGLTLIALGKVAERQGRFEDAVKVYRESLTVASGVSKETGSREVERDVVVALNNLGRVLLAQGARDEAKAAYHECLVSARERWRWEQTQQAGDDLAAAASSVAEIVRSEGALDQARELYVEVLFIARALARERGTPDDRRGVAVALDSLARIARLQERLADAHAAYAECLGIMRELARQQRTPETRRDLALALDHLGRVTHLLGRTDEAETTAREGLEILRGLARDVPTPQAQHDVAACLNNIGLTLQQMPARLAEAEAAFDEALSITRTLAKEIGTLDAWRGVAAALGNLGRTVEMQGRLEEASNIYHEAFRTLRPMIPDYDSPDVRRGLAVACCSLGQVLDKLGQADLASHYWDAARRSAAAYREVQPGVDAEALFDLISSTRQTPGAGS
jgi:tetratricopeptide (TPR) repeat protein